MKSIAGMEKWPVFICYRQSDGQEAASRLYDLLHEEQMKSIDPQSGNEQDYELDVYFDQAAPAGKDWTEIHEPYLKHARAFVIVCTPGSKLNEGGGDWVHKEIDWWLQNSKTAPILVDALGQEGRYVPDVVAAEWPNAQRIRLVNEEWERLSDQETETEKIRVRNRLIGGITRTGEHYLRRELEQKEEQARQLQTALDRQQLLSRRFRFAFWISAGLSVVAASAALYGFIQQDKAESALLKATEASNQAKHQEGLARDLAKQEATSRQLAEDERLKALTSRNTALLSQSKYLTDLANQAIEAGDSGTGMLLALEAIRDKNSEEALRRERPMWSPASVALDRALRGNNESSILHSHADAVTTVAISPYGKFIASGSADHSVRIWDTGSETEIGGLEGHTDTVTSLAFYPDEKRIVSGSKDGTVRVWDVKTSEQLNKKESDINGVSAIAMAFNGLLVATGSLDNQSIAILDAETLTESESLYRSWANPRDDLNVTSLAMTLDAKRLASGHSPGLVFVWEIGSGELPLQLDATDGDGIRAVAFSSDGKRIFTGSASGMARIWNSENGDEIAVLKGHSGSVNALAETPDGENIITGSEDGTVRIWDSWSGEQTSPALGHEDAVTSLTIMPDGIRLVVGMQNGSVRIRNLNEGSTEPIWRAMGSGARLEGVVELALSRDGKQILVGMEDRSIRTLNFATGEELDYEESWDQPMLKGENLSVRTISPDGQRAAEFNGDGLLVYDALTKSPIAILRLPDEELTAFTFTPEGKRIVTGSSNDSVRIWEDFGGTQAIIDRAKSTAKRCLTEEQRVQYHLDPAPPVWCITKKKWPYHTDIWAQWLARKDADKASN